MIIHPSCSTIISLYRLGRQTRQTDSNSDGLRERVDPSAQDDVDDGKAIPLA